VRKKIMRLLCFCLLAFAVLGFANNRVNLIVAPRGPDPGILQVTDGPCMCWFTPTEEHWMAHEDCVGWGETLPGAEVDIRYTEFPRLRTHGYDGWLDFDIDGDIDEFDQTVYNGVFPHLNFYYPWVYGKGDLDLDGVVGTSDFDMLLDNFGETEVFYECGDFNHNGTVDLHDMAKFQTYYGRTYNLELGIYSWIYPL